MGGGTARLERQGRPEFGYRYLVEEARDAGQSMAERTAWRICSDNQWWSAFGKKKRGKNGKAGPPVHDDLVGRIFGFLTTSDEAIGLPLPMRILISAFFVLLTVSFVAMARQAAGCDLPDRAT